jgi:hypothetical protein
MIVETVENISPHVQVEGVLCVLIQKIRGLHQLRPDNWLDVHHYGIN